MNAFAGNTPEPSTNLLYVARQPIFDRHRRLYAYELLFRDNHLATTATSSGDIATQATLLNSWVDIGIDRIAGNHRIFVNFTAQTLTDQLPHMFPSERLVVEILEDVQPTPEVVNACAELHRQGYMLALDDFEYSPALEPLIDLAAIIKLDFLTMTEPEVIQAAARLRRGGVALLAEKVETQTQYACAQALGFEYFQGYFFSKPEVIGTTSMKSAKINLLQVLAEIGREDFEPRTLEQLFSRDVALSYKLLRYINSAYFSTSTKVTSIRHAIVVMGRKELRHFTSLVLLGDLASAKPLELTRTALVRAKHCELIAEQLGEEPAELFLLGLFSLLDAMLDARMADVMQRLPLSERIRSALVESSGQLHSFLGLTLCFERALWAEADTYLTALGVSADDTMRHHLAAIRWADEMIEAIPG